MYLGLKQIYFVYLFLKLIKIKIQTYKFKIKTLLFYDLIFLIILDSERSDK